MANCAGKPSDHGGWVSGRQILDIYGRKARARPRPHQPVPSQYRIQWGHGSKVRGGERGKPILRFLPVLFWGKCPARMTHHPNGQSWAGATRCMPWGIGGEKSHRSKKRCHDKLTNKIVIFVWWWAVGHRQSSGGRQVHQDQIKVVKG